MRAATLILVFTMTIGVAVAQHPSRHEQPAKAKEREHFVAPLNALGSDYEVLFGDPDKPEMFVIRIYELPGTIIPPHSHAVDEHLTVLKGSVYFGIGEKFNRALLKKVGAGSYAFFPKGTKIFGYVEDGAVVQVDGMGPFHPIQWVHAVKDFSSPDAASTFKFKADDRVMTKGGRGTIRQGYASGPIIQYEVKLENGTSIMVTEADLRKR